MVWLLCFRGALARRDPPDPEASFIACRADRLVAMCAAHLDADGGVMLSWPGVSVEHREHERELVLGLTRRQVLAARRRGCARFAESSTVPTPGR